ncbi:MAG TPA: CBS domain-containing protein [Stellaceae bacterium]|nr:CBS domain-containing protein [Stellaceae bacterium]
MRVADLMRRDFAVANRNDNVQSAAKAMAETDSDVVLIEDDDGLAGLVTERDLLIRVVAPGRDPSATPLWQIMSVSLYTCTEQEEAASVADRMAAHGIDQMPVVDRAGRPIGVLMRHAVLNALSSGSGS